MTLTRAEFGRLQGFTDDDLARDLARGPCPNCDQPGGARYGVEGLCWGCYLLLYPERENKRDESRADNTEPEVQDLTIVSLTDFIGVEEPGAMPLVGDDDNILIPEGGDVMFYGDGGAGKTTLCIDLACSLAAGVDWLGLPVTRAVQVLIVENEGPRPLFRRKLARKAAGWDGQLDGIHVLEKPWGQFTFASDTWREHLATRVIAAEIDVLIVGPLTRVGMNEAGTLQEVRAFMELVADLRRRSLRPLTVAIVHHEGKSGSVSGAWEGAGDTLLHVQAAGNGHTIMHVQKARWASRSHRADVQARVGRLDEEGFEVSSRATATCSPKLEKLLKEQPGWRTATEISAPGRDGERAGSARTATRSRSCSSGIPTSSRAAPGAARRRSGERRTRPSGTCSRGSEQVEQEGCSYGPRASRVLLSCSPPAREQHHSEQHLPGQPTLAQGGRAEAARDASRSPTSTRRNRRERAAPRHRPDPAPGARPHRGEPRRSA